MGRLLKDWVITHLADMFEDAADMIAEATTLAEQQIQAQRDDAARLESEIAALDTEIVDLVRC